MNKLCLRKEVIFNHVLWMPFQGKCPKMSQYLEVQLQSRNDGDEEKIKLSMVILTAHKSSLLCPSCAKQPSTAVEVT